MFLNNLKHPMDSFSVEEVLGLNDKETKKKTNAKDVLDTLITVLRNEHIFAIEEGGTAYSKNIEKALAAAYEHRSGLVYIRPPSAYLRSSYPVTTFQESPQLGWNNMLTDLVIKGLPLISDIFALGNLVDSRQKVREEIDKQFWHNINRVRVSGAGMTNYVVAKDDVGNWYVKLYSTNPTDIIKSAQSLAMFNLSGSMGVNMISRLRQYTTAESNGGSGSEKKSDSSLSNIETLYVKYTNSFNEQVKSDYNLFVKTLKGKNIEDKIKSSTDLIEYIKKTDGVKTDIDETVDKVSVSILDAVVKDLKVVEDIDEKNTVVKLSSDVIDLIYATIRFHNDLVIKIRSGNLVTKKARDNLEEAKNNKKKEEGTLTKAIASVKDVKKEYEELLEKLIKKEEEVKDLELKSEKHKKLVGDATIALEVVKNASKSADEKEIAANKALVEAQNLVSRIASSPTPDFESYVIANNALATAREKASAAAKEARDALAIKESTAEALINLTEIYKNVVQDLKTSNKSKKDIEEKKDEVTRKEKDVSESDERLKGLNETVDNKEKELEKEQQAEGYLVDVITDNVKAEVGTIYNLRNDSVNDYENAIMFIADAVNPDSKPAIDPEDAQRSLSRRGQIANELQINVQNAFGELRNSGDLLETLRGRTGNRQGRGTRLNTLTRSRLGTNRGR